MAYILFFIPVISAMAYAVYGTWRRQDYIQITTILLITVVTLVRFITMTLDFSGYTMTSFGRFLEIASSLYIIPTMYMYLCGQCGTKWNNHEAIFQLLLPFIVLFGTSVIDFSASDNVGGHPDAVAGALNIYKDGERILYIVIRHAVVIVQCLVVVFCMGRLWVRIRSYGLKFTRYITAYYVWMFFMLSAMIVNHALSLDTSRVGTDHFLHFLAFGIIIVVGYLIIPGMFNVAPVVDSATEKPVALNNFKEHNQHLADHLHQLMEEDRIYLRQGIHIDDLAEMMGTNRTYVTRLMRTEFGQTFTDYVNNARIIYSKKLLLTSSMTLEEIAAASGFPNAPSYCRVFKRVTDFTPSAWKSEQGE